MQMFWIKTFAATTMVISMAHHASATVADWGAGIATPISAPPTKTSVPTPLPSSIIAPTASAQTPSAGSFTTSGVSLQAAAPATAGSFSSTATPQFGSRSATAASYVPYAGTGSMAYSELTTASFDLTALGTLSRIAVPEPASIALLGVGLAAIRMRARRLTRGTPKRV
jgi:hypothetical protein